MSNLKVDRYIVFQYTIRQFKFGRIKFFNLNYQCQPTNSNFFCKTNLKIIQIFMEGLDALVETVARSSIRDLSIPECLEWKIKDNKNKLRNDETEACRADCKCDKCYR